MYDKELIQKVCDLTCSEDDVDRDQTTIKYDTECPFKKYYSIATIKGAIQKYLSHEWNDSTLAGWACIYCWILSGGSDDNVTEDLNAFESFFRDFVTWDLDGLAFFSEEDKESYDLQKSMAVFEDYDHILQTRNEWKAVYAMIGSFAETNGDQFVLLINDTRKEYMIMYSDHLENGYEDEYFRFVSQEEHVALVEQLKNQGYTMLSCSEEFYDLAINDEEEFE